VGRNPTVAEGQEIRAETHILDFFEDLYDREIKVEFLQMLREEKKFDSIEELQNQLNRDIEEVRAHFSKIKK
jgi:riboflavin kinase/FMN adenylyltransferase